MDRFVAESESREAARLEVFDEDICARDQTRERFVSAWSLEVERDALLAPIEAQKIAAPAVHDRRKPTDVIAAARILDLDHLRAHVGEEHRAVRACKNARQIDDRNSSERSHAVSVAPV